jgi:phage-related protein
VGVLNGDWDKAFQAMEDTASGVWEGIKRIFRGAIDFLGGIFGGVYELLKLGATGAFEAITDAITGVVDKMFGFGEDIVTGIIDGVKSMGSWLGDQFKKHIIDPLPEIVKTTLGISSPSKVFAGLGREIPAGMVQGINRGAGDVKMATANMLAIPSSGTPAGLAAGLSGGHSGGVTIGDIHIYGANEPNDPRWADQLTQAIAAGVGRR